MTQLDEFRKLKKIFMEIEKLVQADTDENFEKLSKLWDEAFVFLFDNEGHHRAGFRGKFNRWLKNENIKR
jgi:hypothetical protein